MRVLANPVRICLLVLVSLLGAVTARAEIIAISASPIPSFSLSSSDDRIGRLRFVGGLELSSQDERFGGLSGLRLSTDGLRLSTVSDAANWFRIDLQRGEGGRLSGVTGARIACLCRRDGTRYGSKHWGDSEALEIRGSTAFVGYERLNRINRYQLDSDGLPGAPVQATASFRPLDIAYNEGLEAVALAPDGSHLSGRFIAIAEESLDAGGNNRAFIADARSIDEFSISRSGEYSVTDAAFLPDGDLIILERRFGFSVGLGMRVRRFGSAGIRPGVTLDGEVLGEAGLTSRIDNMEGIAAWTDSAGQTRIALISDDNFNRSLQRTLLLEFVLEAE